MPSRQRLWQKKMVSEGKCSLCAKPRNSYKQLCDACQIKQRKRRRLTMKYSPQVPGNRGRSPRIDE